MLTPRFRLTLTNKADLEVVCGIDLASLNRVCDLIQAEQFTIRRSRIEEVIQSEIGSEKGSALGRVLFGIAGTFRRTTMSASEALDGLSEAIGEQKDDSSTLKAWVDYKPVILRMLKIDSVKLAAKALDISYDFERVYVTGRVLTSIRPIFDEPREEIVGSTIVQTLRVEYLGANGSTSSISVAMDLEDIKDLQEECRRAIVKANASRKRIEKDCDINAIIPGEESK